MPKPDKHRHYLAWLAEQSCCVTGCQPVVVHHLTRLAPMQRITRNDRYAVPLVPELHAQDEYAVHDIGVSAFEQYHGVDLTALAEHYWRKWSDDR
jgi:hypothetical protein